MYTVRKVRSGPWYLVSVGVVPDNEETNAVDTISVMGSLWGNRPSLTVVQGTKTSVKK
ncbi:MAG: hypothetical protein NTV68_04480 [Methanomicrobiales archaeon]|nr:hypothetical protein [Methanomicrobiales archaeon]